MQNNISHEIIHHPQMQEPQPEWWESVTGVIVLSCAAMLAVIGVAVLLVSIPVDRCLGKRKGSELSESGSSDGSVDE